MIGRVWRPRTGRSSRARTFHRRFVALQALMRIVFDIFLDTNVKSTSLTKANFAGQSGGAFDRTSPDAFAIAMLVLEAVGVAKISTKKSLMKHGIPGCVPPPPPKRARAAPARALLRVAHALAPRRCRSADLNTEEGRLQFAAYVRGAIHGRTCDASKSPSFIMDIESLGLDGRSYKELVRSCADACIIMRWRVFVHLGFR